MNRLRTQRIGEQMMRELSVLLRQEIKDPRVPAFTGVTAVEVTNDLGHATCFLQVPGEASAQKACLQALDQASGFLRRSLADRMRLRVMPALHFKLDDSLQQGQRIEALLDEALRTDAKRKQEALYQQKAGVDRADETTSRALDSRVSDE